MKKTTKSEFINRLLEMEQVQADKECVDFLKNELILLSNRKSGGNGEKAKEKKNLEIGIKDSIVRYLTGKKEGAQATVIARGMDLKDADGNVFSSQKITSILKKMMTEEHNVIRRFEKKTAYFILRAEATPEDIKAFDGITAEETEE